MNSPTPEYPLLSIYKEDLKVSFYMGGAFALGALVVICFGMFLAVVLL